jgi:uncharacterized protein (DUF58 family)
MDTHELLRRITTLPIVAEALSEDMLAGNFRSVFKGQGMEFDEARHYQWGDDVRLIDWNASARFGSPFIKMYREERELTIMLLLDTSASMRRGGSGLQLRPHGDGVPKTGGEASKTGSETSGTEPLSPYEQALLASALIAFSAERSGQRVGAILFDHGIERVFPPGKGRRHSMTLIAGALQYQSGRAASHSAAGTGSDLRAAIAGAARMLKRRSMVLVLSDFLSVQWEESLGDLCRKHDVIAIRVSDPLDTALDDFGLLTMQDPETGLRIEAPAGNALFRAAWAQWHTERADRWLSVCRRAGAAHLELSSNADAAAVLFRFFSRNRERP